MSKKRQKAVVITGTSGDIGSTIASVFSAKKYFVVGIDKKNNPAVNLDAFIKQDLQKLTLNADVLKLEKKLGSLLKDKTLSALINNAAVQIPGRVNEITVDGFTESLQVNTVAPFILVRICLDRLKQGKGNVINIGSIHALCTKPSFTAYATSKAALAGLTRSLAVELGEYGISVNCIQPGAVETAMLRAGFENSPDRLEKLNEYIPIGHVGRPAEIADLALFLAEAGNSYISGASIAIDGGSSSRLHDPD